MEKKSIIRRLICRLCAKGMFNFIPDKQYLKILYWARIGKHLNLKNPRTYNEKLQWLKLYNRRPEYVKMVDKYEVKKYVANRIGENYIIPTLGVWDSFDDIDFNILPEQFVMKCTHDSGGVVVCRDKRNLNLENAREKITKSLNRNYFWQGREWPYKNIKPRIIVEQYLEDDIEKELKDYKFFCFDGEPKAMYVASDRGIEKTKFDFFDLNFNHLDIVQHYPNSNKKLNKPQNFDEMINLSKKLSKGFKHVRVDFYEVNGKLYFGELTFYHMSGLSPFNDIKWDKQFGEWLKIN